MIFENFEERITDPWMWIYKGDELKYAADVLAEFEKLHVRPSRKHSGGVYEYTFISIMPQVMMLYAFAIENYIKSLLVMRGKISIKDNKVFGVSHSLTGMLESIGFNIEDGFKELLDKYERHIYWEGRYPSPKKKELLTEDCNEKNVSKWPNSYVVDYDIEAIKRIIGTLLNIIDAELEKK